MSELAVLRCAAPNRVKRLSASEINRKNAQFCGQISMTANVTSRLTVRCVPRCAEPRESFVCVLCGRKLRRFVQERTETTTIHRVSVHQRNFARSSIKSILFLSYALYSSEHGISHTWDISLT
jgi:hypothetical protein